MTLENWYSVREPLSMLPNSYARFLGDLLASMDQHEKALWNGFESLIELSTEARINWHGYTLNVPLRKYEMRPPVRPEVIGITTGQDLAIAYTHALRADRENFLEQFIEAIFHPTLREVHGEVVRPLLNGDGLLVPGPDQDDAPFDPRYHSHYRAVAKGVWDQFDEGVVRELRRLIKNVAEHADPYDTTWSQHKLKIRAHPEQFRRLRQLGSEVFVPLFGMHSGGGAIGYFEGTPTEETHWIPRGYLLCTVDWDGIRDPMEHRRLVRYRYDERFEPKLRPIWYYRTQVAVTTPEGEVDPKEGWMASRGPPVSSAEDPGGLLNFSMQRRCGMAIADRAAAAVLYIDPTTDREPVYAWNTPDYMRQLRESER